MFHPILYINIPGKYDYVCRISLIKSESDNAGRKVMLILTLLLR